jgi:ABC-type branched-subunit amino acid transport system ATPase component
VPLLDVRNLHVHYGKCHALRGVSLSLGKNQIVTLIGANGAGKSTTLRAISGILGMTDGDVVLEGESLKELPPHRIVAKGIVHVLEGRRIFGRLTVAENLRLGAFLHKDKQWLADMEARALDMFPALKERPITLKRAKARWSGWDRELILAQTRHLLATGGKRGRACRSSGTAAAPGASPSTSRRRRCEPALVLATAAGRMPSPRRGVPADGRACIIDRWRAALR